MDSFADSDSYAGRTSSTRSSYASTIGRSDQSSNSSRSSYASISESFGVASRKSDYFRPEGGLDRISSFSRTADTFYPPSESSSPQTYTLTPTVENENPMNLRGSVEPVKKDGAQALQDLKEVQNIICVAFGAFDRYYMAWEDKNGHFHQEGHKLPEKLHSWLFPTDGNTRDFQTLQVTFGSNDEFFASDRFGKISSRDSPPPAPASEAITERPVSSRHNSLTRPKAHTVSTSMPAEHLKRYDTKPPFPKIERRKTDLFTRMDLKQESQKSERRRSIITSGTPIPHSWEYKRALPRLQTQGIQEVELGKTKYVDAGVQTEKVEIVESNYSKQKSLYYHYIEPRNLVSIGSMQDFCRTHQYSLGDGLRYM